MKKSKSAKEQLEEEDQNNPEDDFCPETEFPEPVKIPEYTLMDVMRELKTLKNDIGVYTEAVRALGEHVMQSSEEANAIFMDFQNQIQQLQAAFIATVPDRINQQPPRSNIPISKPAPEQPKYDSEEIKVNLPAASTFPISEGAKKDLVFGFRAGVGSTVKFSKKVSKDDWNNTNTFLRALNMKWASIKEHGIFEWQPKR